MLRPVDPNAGNRGMLEQPVANRATATSLPLSAGAVRDARVVGSHRTRRRLPAPAWLHGGCGPAGSGDVVRGPGMGRARRTRSARRRRCAGCRIRPRRRMQPQAATGIMRLAGLALDPDLVALAVSTRRPRQQRRGVDGDRPPRRRGIADRAWCRGGSSNEEHLALDGGFEAGRIYEVVYRTAVLPGRRRRVPRGSGRSVMAAPRTRKGTATRLLAVSISPSRTGASQSGSLPPALPLGRHEYRTTAPTLSSTACTIHTRRRPARRVQFPLRAAGGDLARPGRCTAVHN